MHTRCGISDDKVVGAWLAKPINLQGLHVTEMQCRERSYPMGQTQTVPYIYMRGGIILNQRQ